MSISIIYTRSCNLFTCPASVLMMLLTISVWRKLNLLPELVTSDQTTDQVSSQQSSMATNKINTNRRRIIETKYTQKEMKSYGKKYLLFTNNILE